MKLTREILDQITKDATFARDIESIIVSVHPKTVLALVAEVERQREEIAALRRFVQALIKEGARTPDDVDYAEYVESYERAMGARPDAPAPEPAPRRPRLGDTLVNAITVGSRVRIKESGEYAHVTRITHDGDKRLYVVTCEDFTGTVYALPTEDIELAKTEAPEIKVGDRVRIIEKHLMFSGESGHIMSIDGELYRVWLDVNLDPGENGISYYRNEIEPA